MNGLIVDVANLPVRIAAAGLAFASSGLFGASSDTRRPL
jgi:hypothetical protein